MADFRTTPGRNARWHEASGAFSNFEFLDRDFGSHPILRRIFSLARKLRFGGFFQETIHEPDCALLAEENHALAAFRPGFRTAEVTRFTFFTGTKKAPGNLLGYAVFKLDCFSDGSSRGHVFEAVFPPPRGPRENNFVHCGRRYEVCTAIGLRPVQGVLYAQQNDATFVCAHVALRTVLASLLPSGDASYAEINRHAGLAHASTDTTVGHGRGLSPAQLEAVLQGHGLATRRDVHEPGAGELPEGLEFQRLLYDFIESGRPAILGFELSPDPVNGQSGRHAIPVFGHTFNEDLWVPEAERAYFAHNRGYFPSESWLSSYLAHDDNFGPYLCLPRHYLGRAQFRVLVGSHPADITLPAAEAEALAFDLTNALADNLPPGGSPWFERFRAFARAGLLVLRAHTITAEAYRAHLHALRDREGHSLDATALAHLGSDLPARGWLVELSAPELFPATRAKFGEVFLDASAPLPGDALQAVRLPGLAARLRDGQLALVSTPLVGHTPLYTIPDTPSPA
jgi:hypothetical protein